MKIFLSILLISLSLGAQVKYQEPIIPAEQGKLYNEIIALRTSSPQKALSKFSELPQNYSAAFDYLHAIILIDQKLDKRAITFLRQALKKLPTFYQARLTMTQLILAKNEYKAALPELLEIVKLGRADGQVWKNISICHLELKNFGAAEAALNQSKIFLPANENIDKALLNIYIQMEEYQKAEKLAEKLLDQFKEEKQYWKIYIQSLLANKKSKKALFHQEIMTRLFKTEDHDLKLLGDLYYNEKIYLKAAPIYLKVEGQLSGRAILLAARSYSYAQDFKKVIGILKSTKLLSPSEKSEFYKLQGQAYLKLKQNEKALSSLLNALKFDSQNSSVLFKIAEIYEKSEQYEQALDFYSRASKDKNYFVSSKLRKARIYINLNLNQNALQEVEAVKSVDNSSATNNFLKYLKSTTAN